MIHGFRAAAVNHEPGCRVLGRRLLQRAGGGRGVWQPHSTHRPACLVPPAAPLALSQLGARDRTVLNQFCWSPGLRTVLRKVVFQHKTKKKRKRGVCVSVYLQTFPWVFFSKRV